MDVNYKILCEVKLLHEYYLTDKDGTTVFDKPVQADRLAFLYDRYRFDYPSVSNHLAYEPATPFKQLFGDHRLRIIPSYSGFKVFVSVKEKMLAGGIKAFSPAYALADDLPVIIQLRSRNDFLDSLSNESYRRAVPARYYFTNRSLGSPQQPPFLAQAPPLKSLPLTQEQGELVFDNGDNRTKAVFYEKDGTKNWLPIKGSGYVNGNDCSLLPPAFTYSFYNADAITDASFTLKDSGGTTVSTITRTAPILLKKIDLDFSSVAPLLLGDGGAPMPYTLEVAASNGYSKAHPVIFCTPALIPSDTWGLVHLQPRPADPQFQLIDDDGLLHTRRHADGTMEPAPVFEIRIKSRFAFWRYRNTRNEKILDNATLHPFLVYDGARGMMETKQMLNASYTPIEFSNMGSTQYLPNPDADSPLLNELQRIYTDIRVPKSDLFKI